MPENPNAEIFREGYTHSAASEALDQHLTASIAEFTTERPAVTAPSPTGFVPGEISSMFKMLRERKAAMVTELMANGAEFAAVVEAGEQMSATLRAESEAMKAEFGQTSNFPPA